VFDKMPKRNLVAWTSLIAGYSQYGQGQEALSVFSEMQRAGVEPNEYTLSSVLKACAGIEALQQGEQLHARTIKADLESDVVLGNALIDMYAKCGRMEDACQVFGKMSRCDVVSFTGMIAGYAKHGSIENAREVFDRISQRDVFSWTAMVSGYAKCGSIEEARQMFDRMPHKNVVSWNAMIAAYAQHGHGYAHHRYGEEALSLFCQMLRHGMKPDQLTFASILSSCAGLAALEQGKQVHSHIIKIEFESYVILETALVDMYAKSGRIETARQVFDEMSQKDVVSWNVMIAGYGKHGKAQDGLELFEQMQEAGVTPTSITFVSVLSACSHAGLVDEGWHYFNCMSQYHAIKPIAEHYACMVDLLGRAGQLEEAALFIETMPVEPGADVLGALLAACRVHGNIELGEKVAERIFEQNPNNSGTYVVLSNIYAAAGRWDDAAKIRKLMTDRGVIKEPGCSWIEFKKKVHVFFVGDRSHPQTEEIYAALHILAGKMKLAGYVPDTNLALHDVDEEQKEHILCYHSEKLAIAFALINTTPGTIIQIVKNLRVCIDCHTATKFISKITEREIVVRDANRFHHFKDGFCSCGDYW
jgi:pentatricopeptide repeat protein